MKCSSRTNQEHRSAGQTMATRDWSDPLPAVRLPSSSTATSASSAVNSRPQPGFPPGYPGYPGYPGCPGCPGSCSGFSLVEMMVVLVLIGLLASVVTINVRGYLVRGRQDTARMELATLRNAVETYYGMAGRYPTNEEGLSVLAQSSDALPEPLIDQAPVDPWGRPYQYFNPGRDGRPYEILCYGADGREGGQGADADISSWALRQQTEAQP